MGPVKPGPSDKTATPAHVGGVSKVRRDSSASIHNITQLCNDLTISSPRVGRIKNRNLPRGTRSISSYFSDFVFITFYHKNEVSQFFPKMFLCGLTSSVY